jgi:hypothetical protein
MTQDKLRYIPAGCTRISKAQVNLDEASWSSEELQKWNSFQLQDGDLPPRPRYSPDEESICLRSDLQILLLQATGMNSYARLFRAQWIKLEFKVIDAAHQQGILRVYLLPDDVHRRTVDRSDPRLKKARAQILQSLDYSRGTWNGIATPVRLNHPIPFSIADEEPGEELSLLQLFNKIPSPNPDPESVCDRDYQDVINDILDSKITGLNTELYDYQRRSAAVMLQKEAQPSQVLDPRLLHAQDQEGSSWYLDPVAGTVLLEPRHYDGIPGGILAEEMGSGKTLICLTLILATRYLPTQPPELYSPGELPVRKQIASLADMAAACANRYAVPWKPYFDVFKASFGFDFDRCIEALEKNPGHYYVPAPEPRRGGRHPNQYPEPPTKIFLSAASVIVVPNNLMSQWLQEIKKHTTGLDVVVIAGREEVPNLEVLRKCDIILFSQSRFETLVKQFGGLSETPLSQLHFKRCIVDEGHKLGNSKIGHRSNLLIGLDALRFSSRWIVTGTPSRGLFGVDAADATSGSNDLHKTKANELNITSSTLEKEDLERIGAITALYLKARPWANTTMEVGDTTADWTTYLMLPKHNPKSRGRWGSLKTTLNSLIVRHQLAEIGNLLPPVDEKIVVLEGSYQDRLSLNIFSMMIIFNTVQSQRTDMDYFFHPKQRKNLLQIVHNLKQSSFFGGSFFTSEEIATSVKTAEEFLAEGKVPISAEDESLLREAIALGRLSVDNKLRNLSNQFHEIPVTVTDFPAKAGSAWSLDGESGDVVCTSASMLLALQKLIYNSAKEPEALNSLLNGGLMQAGLAEREKIIAAETQKNGASEGKDSKSQILAGNTKLGDDSPRKTRSHGVNGAKPDTKISADVFSGPLELTRIVSTASAKLSYLIDGIVKHQAQEKIIVFYENENIAWYLASMLDVVSLGV